MSQHATQQQTRPDVSLAPSERTDVCRPASARSRLAFVALALTATLSVLIAVVYVGAYARVTENEYTRQALYRELRSLEVENARLRCDIDALRSQAHLVAAATAQQLVPADPATGVDYVLVPSPGQGEANPAGTAPTWLLARKEQVAAALTGVISPPGLRGTQISAVYPLKWK